MPPHDLTCFPKKGKIHLIGVILLVAQDLSRRYLEVTAMCEIPAAVVSDPSTTFFLQGSPKEVISKLLSIYRDKKYYVGEEQEGEGCLPNNMRQKEEPTHIIRLSYGKKLGYIKLCIRQSWTEEMALGWVSDPTRIGRAQFVDLTCDAETKGTDFFLNTMEDVDKMLFRIKGWWTDSLLQDADISVLCSLPLVRSDTWDV